MGTVYAMKAPAVWALLMIFWNQHSKTEFYIFSSKQLHYMHVMSFCFCVSSYENTRTRYSTPTYVNNTLQRTEVTCGNMIMSMIIKYQLGWSCLLLDHNVCGCSMFYVKTACRVFTKKIF